MKFSYILRPLYYFSVTFLNCAGLFFALQRYPLFGNLTIPRGTCAHLIIFSSGSHVLVLAVMTTFLRGFLVS